MFFEAFNPGLGVNRSTLGAALPTLFPTVTENLCGACNDCASPPPLPHSAMIPSAGRAAVHCFEPGEVNYDRLTRTKAHLLPGSEGQYCQVRRLAVANATGTVRFKNFKNFFEKHCSGELCSIDESAQDADIVTVSSVDDLMRSIGLSRLFVLKIDTEGFDPLVLDGARRTLAAQNVEVLLFEYHGINHWNVTQGRSLKQTVTELAQLGYVCYFEGVILTRLTNCWTDAYEIRYWSNVVCALQGSHVHYILERKSFTYPWE